MSDLIERTGPATFESQPRRLNMPKLTSKIAMELVTRIEALNDQIAEVYREANDYDGMNNVNVIRDIVKAREEANDQKCIAGGLLEALDLDEDEE